MTGHEGGTLISRPDSSMGSGMHVQSPRFTHSLLLNISFLSAEELAETSLVRGPWHIFPLSALCFDRVG